MKNIDAKKVFHYPIEYLRLMQMFTGRHDMNGRIRFISDYEAGKKQIGIITSSKLYFT